MTVAEVEATPIDVLAHQSAITLADGKVIHAGRLPLDKVLALARVAGTALAGSSATAAEVKDAAQGKDWAALFAVLDIGPVSEMLSIVTGEPADYCATAFDLGSFAQVVEAVVANNDIGPLARVFTGAVSKVSPPSSKEASSESPT